MGISSIVRRLVNVILCAAVAAVAVFAVGPHTGQYRTLTVLSGSMEPTFAAGDVVIVTPMPARSLRKGHVITYEAPVDGRPVVTHRVEKIVRGGPRPTIVTKGDANAAADPWTAKLDGSSVWRQRAVVPWAGHAIRLMRSTAAKNAAIAGTLLLLVLMLHSIWRPARPAADAVDEWLPHDAWWDEALAHLLSGRRDRENDVDSDARAA